MPTFKDKDDGVVCFGKGTSLEEAKRIHRKAKASRNKKGKAKKDKVGKLGEEKWGSKKDAEEEVKEEKEEVKAEPRFSLIGKGPETK